MLIGYIRATREDGFEGIDEQFKAITKYGVKVENICVDMIYNEKLYPVLNNLLKELKSGDILVIVSIDKLANTMKESLNIINDLTARKISLITIPLNRISKIEDNKNIPNKKTRRRITKELLLKAIDMINGGKKISYIAKYFGIHISTLYNYINNDGLLKERGQKLLNRS